MSILKMKRLSVMAVSSQWEELLDELMLLGCVELSDPPEDAPEWLSPRGREEAASLQTLRSKQGELLSGVKLLEKYAPKEKDGFLKPLPDVKLSRLLDESAVPAALEFARSISDRDDRIRRLAAEKSRLSMDISSLRPWEELDIPLDCQGTATCAVSFATLPASVGEEEAAAALRDATELAQLFFISSDKSTRYLALLCWRDDMEAALSALRPLGFTFASPGEAGGRAKKLIAAAEARIAECEAESEKLALEIAEDAARRRELQLAADTLTTRISRAEATSKLLKTESASCFEGWVPGDRLPELEKLLSKYDCAWDARDPSGEELPDVPVKLKNNRLTRSLSMVTEMYSLPAYDGVDPNPLMAPFFILFYGLMLADIGYGLLMILAAIVVLAVKKPKKGSRNFFELMLWCGISTTIWGAVTGGCFGDAPLQVAKIIDPNTTWQGMPKLFSPLDDTVMILIGAMALGFIHIITGMLVSFVEKAKSGHFMDGVWDEGTWWVIFAGIACMVLDVGTVSGIPVVLCVGALMLIVGSGRNAKGIGKITAVFGALYNGVTGFFGDILSYSRIMALMLAGSVIAQVFNTIGGIAGNLVVFFIVSIIGNALNFALNLLGCYVHDLRLQCLEFFGKFYKDGGRPFKPLAVDPKYVSVENDV